MKYIKNILLAIALSAATTVVAKPIDEAKSLYQKGEYQEALTRLNAILKSSPRDGTANYYKGLTLLALGDNQGAIKPLETAEDRGIAQAAWQLTQLAYDAYEIDEAAEHLDTYERLMRKSSKKLPAEAEELRQSMLMARNMLQRVERLQIIDSLTVDSANFFKRYMFSSEAGSLLPGKVLPPAYASRNPKIAYKPESGKEVFWGMKPEGGEAVQLYSASILDDGTMEEPTPLGEQLGEGGDADFPFFASDGMTFYFANNGENSLGGYDIFMSRREGDGTVLEPQNMGMPYNSPYDDYMLAIDENTGIGMWATNRNQIPGKITIYVYTLNDTRVNYDPDDENLVNYAFIRDIKSTQGGDSTRPAVMQAVITNEGESLEETPEFMLSMGNGQVYSQLSDFKNRKARQAMEQYLERVKDTRLMESKLATLRSSWAQGDHGVRDEILSLEKRLAAADGILKKMRNQVINLEK